MLLYELSARGNLQIPCLSKVVQVRQPLNLWPAVKETGKIIALVIVDGGFHNAGASYLCSILPHCNPKHEHQSYPSPNLPAESQTLAHTAAAWHTAQPLPHSTAHLQTGALRPGMDSPITLSTAPSNSQHSNAWQQSPTG